jgi:tRNA(Ile2) C34 agmatinyltransferase TiaS
MQSNIGPYADIDLERDQIGVILDSPVVCGTCATHMDHVGKHLYRCPRCGYVYDEVVAP